MSTLTNQQSSNSSKIRKLVGRLRSASNSTRTTPDASTDSSPAASRPPSLKLRTPRDSPPPTSFSSCRRRKASSSSSHDAAVAAASLGLWNAAYDALRDNPGCVGLVVAYETIISQELPDSLKLGGANSSFRGKTPEQRRELLSAIAAAGLRKRRGSKASLADDASRRVLDAAKEAVEGLWPAYPAAAVAWAGFCTLTPVRCSSVYPVSRHAADEKRLKLLLDAIMQRDDIRAGLVHVVGRIPWYMHLAQLPSSEPQQRETLVRLYRWVLEFEMNCVCATASAWNAAAKNVVGWAGLCKLTQTIREADDKVAAIVRRQGAVDMGNWLQLNADLDLSSPSLANKDDEQLRPPDEGRQDAQVAT
ncbi:hypothetical protein TOPH_02895 [Tolypocladium ophioglossoides CBS 100239]|uniref:NWD NACHT-NTPase N-terminal domain-containing protein n=1 Tax=Tolypocladium ophioglossoides (strain CBS 100239) TaxID=1163406 RepID=A0A0L0NES5_TOLOC|nr:hypothetical protein TOPH_02895 [Tolypocladium ophioglossoides CBS 100239]